MESTSESWSRYGVSVTYAAFTNVLSYFYTYLLNN